MPNQNLNSNNLKSLAASIAHETKNPLSTIKSACEIIKNNLDEVMEYLDLISTSSTRGLGIIDVILTNIKEQGIDKSKFVYILISTTVEAAIREYAFESDNQRKSVNVDLRDDFDFKGDETLMIFVLFNLLKNSLYYKTKINIWLDGNNRRLYFKDNGTGISSDKLKFIFDDFFTSNKKSGTGLGLAFCKRVMKAFGGDISCKSKEGEGVEFCLQFKNPINHDVIS